MGGVLRPAGWLVLYQAGSTGRIALCPAFDAWRREVFHVRYPKVARNHEPLTREVAATHGFEECANEVRSHIQRHRLDHYVENLLTHSRVIRATEDGQEPVADTRAWLKAELSAFFTGGEAEFVHESRMHVLRRELTI